MGQFDLERAATWAMIGSHRHQDETNIEIQNNVPKDNYNVHIKKEIDYKKVMSIIRITAKY